MFVIKAGLKSFVQETGLYLQDKILNRQIELSNVAYQAVKNALS